MRRKRCDTGAMESRVVGLREEKIRMRSSSESVDMMSGEEGRGRLAGLEEEEEEEEGSLRFGAILEALRVCVCRVNLRGHRFFLVI